MRAAAYDTYIAHVDGRVRAGLIVPDSVAPVQWINDTTARWNGDERSVEGQLLGNGRIEFLLRLASEEFPYDRFHDDLQEPDLASTARTIAEFFNDAAVEEPPR